MNLRSYQKPRATVDHLAPNHTQSLSQSYIRRAGSAHWPPSLCYDLFSLCEKPIGFICGDIFGDDEFGLKPC